MGKTSEWTTFPLADHRHQTYRGSHIHGDGKGAQVGETHRHPYAGTSLLCRLGFHDWGEQVQNANLMVVERICRRCPAIDQRSYMAVIMGDKKWQRTQQI